jgi:glycolate oxidase
MVYKRIGESVIEKLRDIVAEENLICEPEKMVDYSHDEFALESIRKLPEVVVKPKNKEEISQILKLANKEKFPVTPRGGATGLVGSCVPVHGGLVLSLENMKEVLEVDTENLMAVVEAGVPLMEFYKRVEEEGLFFPPHPGEESANIGGVIATNAGGTRAVKYGVIRNFVKGVEVVLPRGEIIEIGGKIMKDSTGYSLLNLMIGSEGTLGIITKATLSLLPPPKAMLTLVVPFNGIRDAINTVPMIIKSKTVPMAIEFVEKEPILVTEEYLQKRWPCREGQAYLMIIIDGTSEEELMKLAESVAELCSANNALDVFVADTKERQDNVLNIRSQIYEAIKPYTIEILDITVPRAEIAGHVERVHEIADKYDVWLPTYGHAGDGNVHTHLMKAKFREGKIEETKAGWEEKYRQVRKELHIDGLNRGGTISGEHGIGIVKKEYLSMALSEAHVDIMRGIKKVFDPENILNPGKMFNLV